MNMNEQLLTTTSPQILGPFYPLDPLADMDANAKRVEFNIVLMNG
jgi:hypothetical protein